MRPINLLSLALLADRHEILVNGWLVPPPRPARTDYQRRFAVIDADFERVEGGDGQNQTQTVLDVGTKSLFQLSLDADPELNQTRIPFLDGENFIDVKLAFMAELDGVQYGIGVPYDHAAAVTIEQKDGTVVNLSPDDAESEELIRIMADQLKEHVGEDLALKKTPRVLTIKGPLEKYTQDWKDKVTPEAFDAKTLLDDSDEDLQFFHDFMKKELGENEYRKTLEEDPGNVDQEILDIFGAMGQGEPETVKDLFSDEDGFLQEMEEFVNKDISHDGAALKLISYSLPDGNKYSVVQPINPYALVAKFTENEDDIRFDLLSPKESELLIPRLEDAFREDLEKAGLSSGDIIN